MKDTSPVPSSLLQDFTAQQHTNLFLRAFSFSTGQLPRNPEGETELADRVVLMDDIGFAFLLKERENKVATKAGDLEKWIANTVVRKGVKEIQRTRDLLDSYASLSLVNHFGHRVTITPVDSEDLVSVIVYRVPQKSRPFRAPRFKKGKDGGFIHILRDVEYFEICQQFTTPAELRDYFGFRRHVLINWDSAAAAVSEGALIGQYVLEDYSTGPDQRFEKAARAKDRPAAYEFSFVLDSLASTIAGQSSEYADTAGCEILGEIARLGRHELKALKQQLRLGLDAVRGNRFELPFRIASGRTECGFLILPITREYRDRASYALESLTFACKHELDFPRQVGIGMWRKSEFVDIEWTFLEGENTPHPELDERLARSYPFRTRSEQNLPPIFV